MFNLFAFDADQTVQSWKPGRTYWTNGALVSWESLVSYVSLIALDIRRVDEFTFVTILSLASSQT